MKKKKEACTLLSKNYNSLIFHLISMHKPLWIVSSFVSIKSTLLQSESLFGINQKKMSWFMHIEWMIRHEIILFFVCQVRYSLKLIAWYMSGEKSTFLFKKSFFFATHALDSFIKHLANKEILCVTVGRIISSKVSLQPILVQFYIQRRLHEVGFGFTTLGGKI